MSDNDLDKKAMAARRRDLASLRAALKANTYLRVRYDERGTLPSYDLYRVTYNKPNKRLRFWFRGADFTPSINFAMRCNCFIETDDGWRVSGMYSFSMFVEKSEEGAS